MISQLAGDQRAKSKEQRAKKERQRKRRAIKNNKPRNEKENENEIPTQSQCQKTSKNLKDTQMQICTANLPNFQFASGHISARSFYEASA
jgi:hypothetical protein